MSEPVLYSAAEGVAEIRFNRPEVLNAMDGATGRAAAAAIGRALADPAVRVVLLSGEGRSFMAGGDIASFRAAASPQERAALLAGVIEPFHGALLRLTDSGRITLAAAQGPVAGGGMSVFLMADLGILADDATLTMAYSRIGAVPDCGGSHALVRLVGLRRAMEIALLSDPIRAEEAVRLGLANRVVPAAGLRDEARALAARLAAGPPQALARTKALLRGSYGTGLKEQLEAEMTAFVALAAGEDFAEGLDAFFEKRRPRFTGR